MIKKLREVNAEIIADAVKKDPLVKKVNDSYAAYKAKFDAWSGYSEAIYHSKIRVEG